METTVTVKDYCDSRLLTVETTATIDSTVTVETTVTAVTPVILETTASA